MYPSLRPAGGSSQVWQRGFTLIELMAVLGILAILLTVSGGFYSRWREDTRVDAAKEKVVSILQQARLRALSQRSSQAVIFDYNNDTVSFDYSGDGLIQPVAEVEQFPSVDLQDYVCGACGPGANNAETVNFTTRGTSGNLTVQISSAAADKTFFIVLNSVTGRVDIRRSCTGGQCQ